MQTNRNDLRVGPFTYKNIRNRPVTAGIPMLGEATHDKPNRSPAVLIVEDDEQLCEAIGFCVEQAGYEVADCAQSVDAALASLGCHTVDAALLDIDLGGELVYPVANALTARGVPFVFVTGHNPSEIPEQFRHRPVVPKPYYDTALCAALASMLPLARKADV
jgi:CheY-like chemotaxis protein